MIFRKGVFTLRSVENCHVFVHCRDSSIKEMPEIKPHECDQF